MAGDQKRNRDYTNNFYMNLMRLGFLRQNADLAITFSIFKTCMLTVYKNKRKNQNLSSCQLLDIKTA